MKTCRVCKQSFALDNFHKRSSAKDGLRSECKECHKADARKWIAENPERNRARVKAWLAENKEQNKIRRTSYFAEYRAANKERDSVRHSNWKKENKVLVSHYTQKRRAILVQNGVFDISKKELQRLYSSCCTYCGSDTDITLDHVIPIIRGGRHSLGNIVPACKSCNFTKQARTIMEWRKSLTSKPFVK